MKELILLIRPNQWIKNFFVFLPLFFSGNMTNISLYPAVFVSFVTFCLISSSVYCFNDIVDVNSDKLHPVKKYRPIASGKISKKMAYFCMAILVVISFVIPILFIGSYSSSLLVILLLYFSLNILYCLYLKNIAILDIVIISIGFVLRLFSGGIVVNIDISKWIVLMTFLLALFLALAKRRDDLLIFNESGEVMRKNIGNYNMDFINNVLTFIAAVVVVCYIMYTVSEEVEHRLQTDNLYLTSIFVIIGIVRYLQLIFVYRQSGSPTKIVLHDVFLQIDILLWVCTFVLVIYI